MNRLKLLSSFFFALRALGNPPQTPRLSPPRLARLCRYIGLAALLLATPAVAEPEDAISITDTTEIDASRFGLLSPTQAHLTEALWQDTSDARLLALLRDLAHGLPSAALRNLTTRLLLTTSDWPESEQDILAERVDALLRMGQAEYAQQLLREIPKSYRKPQYAEMAFVFRAITDAENKALCAEAEGQLEEAATPFWQRWVVLCQAAGGEKDKAQLGLDLLSEQNQYSEFYQKVVQNLITGKPAGKLPEVVYLEQAAWLRLSGQTGYLQQQSQPPLALVGLLATQDTAALPQEWQKIATRFGLPKASLTVPNEKLYTPDARYLTLPAKGASAADQRIAFLTYGLRKALGHPISLEAEESLRPAYYEAKQVVAAPVWQEQLRTAAQEGRTGEVVLLLASLFHLPLNHYAAADIALAVEALMQCNLPADASALAKEAMIAALALK